MTNITTQADITSNKPPPRYQAKPIAFIFLGFIILGITVMIVMSWMTSPPSQKPKPIIEPLPFVEIQPVILSDNAVILNANGFVSAKYTTDITAEVNGKILSVSDKLLVGEHLAKGDILVTIDKTDYIAAVASAKAALAMAQSTYAQEQAKARQASSDAKNLQVKTTDLLLRKPQLAAAKANIINAKAQLKLANSKLLKTTITSPFNAVVQSQNIAIGDVLNGSKTIAQLVSTDAYTVKLNVNRVEYQLLSIGNTVNLVNPTDGSTWQAVINRFSPGFDTKNRTIGVYIDITNPLFGEKPLLLSTFMQAKITGKIIKNSQWILNSALVENQYLWVKKSDNTIDKININRVYRGKAQTLITFQTPIASFIKRPKDSFYIGEKVTTSNQTKATKQNKTEKSHPSSGEKSNEKKPTAQTSKQVISPSITAVSSGVFHV
ncbi:MAG: efflux RND transporter periplasmic adaptor subunit [Ostreibacterium sp.]